MHLGLLFSESTQSSSVGSRIEKVLAGIHLGTELCMLVGPCRKMLSLHPKDFQGFSGQAPR